MVFVPFILNVRLAANDAPAPIYLYRIVTLHTSSRHTFITKGQLQVGQTHGSRIIAYFVAVLSFLVIVTVPKFVQPSQISKCVFQANAS